MELGFKEAQTAFESASQSARVWTEQWVRVWMFCPNCGAQNLSGFEANRPVADFHCPTCTEEFELKAQKTRFGRKVMDGAFGTMCERLDASNNPNLMLMRYDTDRFGVSDLFLVPKQFFVRDIIEERKPLAATARRAGWVGCNILLEKVPESGKIHVVRDRELAPRALVLEQWKSTLFLRGQATDLVSEPCLCRLPEEGGPVRIHRRERSSAGRRGQQRSRTGGADHGPYPGPAPRSHPASANQAARHSGRLNRMS